VTSRHARTFIQCVLAAGATEQETTHADGPALVQQLVERMLAVRPRLPKDKLAGIIRQHCPLHPAGAGTRCVSTRWSAVPVAAEPASGRCAPTRGLG
jgi:hypothetical protein